MKETPILMCSEMVRATLDDLKTETRRVVRHQPIKGGRIRHLTLAFFSTQLDGVNRWVDIKCPYGEITSRLWVRETFALPYSDCRDRNEVLYQADPRDKSSPVKWKPSIFMPRWASRLTLEITGVRVERVQDITESGAEAEGCEAVHCDMGVVSAREHYESLWDELNGKRGFGWDTNPFVWVIKFRKILT